ncbi:MAG: multicopper oxidase, type 2 [Rhodospirillales bacterium]|nr:multicopper oxidase, type 2 [Rhodospirillales bacterium]
MALMNWLVARFAVGFGLVAIALAVAPAPAAAQAGCGPVPGALENPPEVARVAGGIQSLDLEVRQDGNRLCFVDRNSKDRPGIAPTIRVRPGETLRVRLFNRIHDVAPLRALSTPGHPTDIGGIPDTQGDFEVRPGAYHPPTGNTNLHFHGLEVRPVPCGPGTSPGDDVVRTYFAPEGTKPVPPDACQSAYEIQIPKTQPAGLYWYHTHLHGESEAQTLLGLSGALVVENEVDDSRRQQGIPDRLLIVRDQPIPEPPEAAAPAPNASAAAPANTMVAKAAPAAKQAGGTASALPQCAFGKCINTAAQTQCSAPDEREQETILSVNGISIRDTHNPTGTVPEITVRTGKEEHWRLVNAAASTYVRVHLVDIDESGKVRNVPFDVAALDGVPLTDATGRPQAETHAEPIMVPTGARLEFKVKLDAPAAQHRIVLRTEAVDTGCGGDLMPARDLVSIRTEPGAADGSPAAASARAPGPAGAVQRSDDAPSDGKPVRQRIFAFTEYPRPNSSKTDFTITEVSRPDAVIEPYPMDRMPSSVVEVQPDSVEDWTILNFTHEVHDFHIHQLHFRVLESPDKFLEGRVLDTINLPAASPDANWSAGDAVTPSVARLRMRFHRNISGTFVFHCHLLGHEDKGMMGLIRVAEPGVARPSMSDQIPPHHH